MAWSGHHFDKRHLDMSLESCLLGLPNSVYHYEAACLCLTYQASVSSALAGH